MDINKIFFAPLDLPFNLTELLGEIPSVNSPTNVSPWFSPFWTYEQLLHDPKPYAEGNVWRPELGEFQQKLKKLVELLPLKNYANVRFSMQNQVVRPHTDVNKRDTPPEKWDYYQKIEPCGYRFLLSGSKTALNVHKNDEVIKVTLPEVPCGYIINASACVHSVDDDPNRITLYIRADVEFEQHVELVRRSAIVYKNYVVYK